MLRRTAPALVLLLLLGLPGMLSAQYFGRNKVQYTNFDFKVIQTEHFDVYFYERERVAAMDAARMAERSYARLSKVLNHEFRERKPIILYASHSDFMQTNATQVGGEGTGGVTDFARNRAVMPFTGSYSDFEHVLMHASKVHPQIRQEFESAYAVWWRKVKYSQGGYANGATTTRRGQLSKVENRILIGSAAAAPYSEPDWQEGAVAAGWQALKSLHERAMRASV